MGLTVYGAGESHAVANAGDDWWDVLWPLAEGCTKISPGCEHCSAAELVAHCDASLAVITANGPQWKQRVVEHPERLGNPARWREPVVAFVCPTSDFFHGQIPDGTRETWWEMMVRFSQHTFVIVTKRAASLRTWCKGREVPSNIWLVVSVENDEWRPRAYELLAIDAPVRGVSCEPLLGPVNLQSLLGPSQLNWVIAGPELGPWARLCRADWMRSLRDQSAEAAVPFFTKHEIDGMRWRGRPSP